MSHFDVKFLQTKADGRIVNKLADGSMAVYDGHSKAVFSLNRAAVAAWEACRNQADMTQIVEAISLALEIPVTEDIARVAICDLEEAGLVTSSGAGGRLAGEASRRAVLKTVGAMGSAIAFVCVLTASEQRAHADAGKSLCGPGGGGTGRC